MRRRKNPWDQPWVAIATVGGIIVVVIIALVFFMSGGNTGGQAAPTGQSSPAQVTTKATPGASGSSVTTSVTGINAASIKEAPTATVPVTGVYVHVNYIGSFAGTYGMNGEKLTVRNSGDRVFPLNATTGTVSASFHKEDRSTRHEIEVEIYKDGKAIKFGKNASAYGDVSISSTV